MVDGEYAYMERALFLAARGRGRTSPNPLVGAVIADRDGVVVGQGYHERAGGAHAEVRAIGMAGARARGATLYCTLEPCSHTGRTGPCVERIVESGVARVVAAVEDPNPIVRGRGFAYLRARGVHVDVGLGAAEARRLNQPFFTFVRERRPFVVMKAALSLDGCVAAAPGTRTHLTSAAADRHAHRFRAEVDAIGIGVGTMLADDPWLTARGVHRSRPLTRVVFDRHLRTPPEARLLSTAEAGPVIIVTSGQGASHGARARELEGRGAAIEIVPEGTVRAALERLADRGVTSILLEGGVGIHAAAWREGVVDFVRLYVAPAELGAAGVRWLPPSCATAALHERRVVPLGPDVLIEGYVHRAD